MYFTKKDLDKIERNTSINNNTNNYIFIAHKIKSKTEKEFKKIEKLITSQGYLDGNQASKEHKIYTKLMQELKKKSPDEYEAVYSRT